MEVAVRQAEWPVESGNEGKRVSETLGIGVGGAPTVINLPACHPFSTLIVLISGWSELCLAPRHRPTGHSFVVQQVPGLKVRQPSANCWDSAARFPPS